MKKISEKGRKLLRQVYRGLWIVMTFFIFKSCAAKYVIIDDMIVPEYGPPLALENPIDTEAEVEAEADTEVNENLDEE